MKLSEGCTGLPLWGTDDDDDDDEPPPGGGGERSLKSELLLLPQSLSPSAVHLRARFAKMRLSDHLQPAVLAVVSYVLARFSLSAAAEGARAVDGRRGLQKLRSPPPPPLPSPLSPSFLFLSLSLSLAMQRTRRRRKESVERNIEKIQRLFPRIALFCSNLAITRFESLGNEFGNGPLSPLLAGANESLGRKKSASPLRMR